MLILVLKEEGEAVLSFLDNGLGIPSEIKGKIFDPFFSRKGNQEDVWLGLSMSYGIIQRQEGSLKMKIHTNETFCFDSLSHENLVLLEAFAVAFS